MDLPVSGASHSEDGTASEMLSSQASPASVEDTVSLPSPPAPQFDNPFHIEDLLVFDETALKRMLSSGGSGLTVEKLACSLHGAPGHLKERIEHNLPPSHRLYFMKELQRPVSTAQIETARREVLDGLFWELTYWKTPELYNELTEGEQLHPGIFTQLDPDIRDKVVADIGAGSGRATFACLQHGARRVYAVEPSPGLLRILCPKIADRADADHIITFQGSFDKIPLGDSSVDLALSCSAFTAEPSQGGEPGLAEMRRVTKPGGKIVIIWPRIEDRGWLVEHDFHYVALPVQQEMDVRFRSLESALRCARRFYARNEHVIPYLLEWGRPEVPYSVLGFNPPCDYCWCVVE